MFRKRPFIEGGFGSTPLHLRGPTTRVSLQTTFFIPSSGLTQGPAVSLQPPEAAMAISRPRRSASAAECLKASFHSGVIQTSRFSVNCGTPRLPSNICIPAMPTRFIHSRSAVMPSLVTLPFSQCHQTRGRAESGGLLNPPARASSAALTTAEGDPSPRPSSTASATSATMRIVRLPVLFIPRPPGSPCGWIREAVLAGAGLHRHDRPVLLGRGETVAGSQGLAPFGHGS